MSVKEVGQAFADISVGVPAVGRPPSQEWRSGATAAINQYKQLLGCEWINGTKFRVEATGEKVVDLSRYNIIRQESIEPIHRISVRVHDSKFVKIFEGPKSEADKVIAIIRAHADSRR